MASLSAASRRALTGIVVVGVVLQFVGLSQESYWIDELFSIWTSSADSVPVMVDRMRADVHPPLYQVLLWIWMGVFGDGESATRLLSAVCGAASIGCLYLGLRRTFGTDRALITTALFAACYTTLLFGRTVRSYELLLLLSVLFTVSWLSLSVRLKAGEATLPRGDAALFAVSSVLACATHFYGALLAGVGGLYLLMNSLRPAARPSRKAIWWLVLCTGAACLAVLLGWLSQMVAMENKLAGHFWIKPPDLLFAAKFARVLAGTLPMVVILFPLLAWALWRLIAQARSNGLASLPPVFALALMPCLFLALVALALAVSSSYAVPTVTGRNMLIIFPAFWIGFVALVECGFEWKYAERILVGLACTALVFSVVRLAIGLIDPELSENEHPRAAVAFVAERLASDRNVELVASNPGGTGAFFYWAYYLDRSRLTFAKKTISNDPLVLREAIDHAVASGSSLAVLIDPKDLYAKIGTIPEHCETWQVQLTVALACRPR